MPFLKVPNHLDDVWPLLEDPSTMVYAGGTDVLVRLRAGGNKSRQMVCLEKVLELQGIEEAADWILIKAGTTLSRLLSDPLINRHFPVLVQAVRVLGSPPIRHMGTIGGNICTASPAGDTLPPLIVLQAEVELTRKEAVRRLPVCQFIRGPGKTDIKSGELLTGVRIPKPSRFNHHYFEKVGRRKAMAIAVVSMAALISQNTEGIIEDIRLAWGSVGPAVITSPEVESFLRGRRVTTEALQEAARIAREAVSPISDLRASADYRRMVAGNLLFRLSRWESFPSGAETL